MATVYRNTPKSGAYYVALLDHHGRRLRVTGFVDKRASQKMGELLDRLVAYRRLSEPLEGEDIERVRGLPQNVRNALRAHDVISAKIAEGAKTLAQHIDDWQEWTVANGASEQHAKVSANRMRRIAAYGPWDMAEAIDARVITNRLAREREGGMTQATSNHYVRSIRALCRWLVEQGWIASSPVASLKPVRVTKKRRERGYFTPEQFGTLLDSLSRDSETRAGLSSRDRSLIYRLAIYSGLRAEEIASLRVEWCDLDADPPTIGVPEAYTKNKERAEVPLRQDLADELRTYTLYRSPSTPLFPAWSGRQTYKQAAKILREDLEAAGIPYTDEFGRRRDFHSLRASLATWADQQGLDLQTIRALMRHSNLSQTLSYIKTSNKLRIQRGLAALPDPVTPGQETAAG